MRPLPSFATIEGRSNCASARLCSRSRPAATCRTQPIYWSKRFGEAANGGHISTCLAATCDQSRSPALQLEHPRKRLVSGSGHRLPRHRSTEPGVLEHPRMGTDCRRAFTAGHHSRHRRAALLCHQSGQSIRVSWPLSLLRADSCVGTDFDNRNSLRHRARTATQQLDACRVRRRLLGPGAGRGNEVSTYVRMTLYAQGRQRDMK